MFSNLSIKAKLLGFCSAMCVLLSIMGLVSYISLTSVDEDMTKIVNTNVPNIIMSTSMRGNSLNIDLLTYKFLSPGNTSNDFVKIREELRESVSRYEEISKAYMAVPFVEGEQALYDAQAKIWTEFKQVALRAAELAGSSKPEDQAAFGEILTGPMETLPREHKESLTKLVSFHENLIDRDGHSAIKLGDQASIISVILSLFSSTFAIIFGLFFARSISRSLLDITNNLTSSGQQIGEASQQLSSASQTLSSSATQAASSLQETVASVEELTSMVKRNAESAKEASNISQMSRRSAEEGETEMSRLIQAMTEISQSSRKIEDIINVIDDIAFQTNLLALNAAVEAARAGEQGKGFAVVAEAVRTLAQRSSSAAKDITSLIKESVERIERGSKTADQSGAMLRNIVEGVKKVAELNNDISSASQEQSTGLTQISKAMSELDQATQRNAASSEEVASSAEEMSSQADSMEGIVRALGLVVNGRGTSAYGDANQGHTNYQARPRTSNAPSRRGNVVSLRKNRVTPADIMPLDDIDNDRSLKVGTTDGF